MPMMCQRSRSIVAMMAVMGVIVDPALRVAVAAQAATQPPKRSSAPSATSSAAPVDGGWPRFHNLPSGGSILVYQPQIASWDKQKHMVAFAAVSHRSTTSEKPVMGTIRLESDTQVSVGDRLVRFQPLKISDANFTTLSKDAIREITAQIEQAIPVDERVIALDRVLAGLDKSQIVPKDVEGIKADPPTIFFSTTPAVVMNIDGEPIWSPIKENDLKY